MTIFYIPNPTQYLNLTTNYKQQIRSLLREKSWLMVKWTLKKKWHLLLWIVFISCLDTFWWHPFTFIGEQLM